MLGYALGAAPPSVSGLHLILAKTPGVQVHANYRSNLYYGSSQIYAAASGVTDSVPSGEPTTAGLLVNGSDAPTLVQGVGPVPHSGYSTEDRLGDELVPNGTFDQNIDDWTDASEGTGSSSWGESGALKLTKDGGGSGVNEGMSYVEIPVVIGDTYKYSANHLSTLISQVGAGVGVGQNFQSGNQGGVVEQKFVATHNPTTITIRNFAIDGDRLVDDVSLRRVYRDHTVKVAWDANSATGDRVVWSARKDASNYLVLHFVSGALRFESFVGGASQGAVTVAGKDDGGAHSAVLYWDETSKALSVRADGAPAVTVTATSIPTNLIQFALGHLDGANPLNGLILEHAAANGNQLAAWKDMPF